MAGIVDGDYCPYDKILGLITMLAAVFCTAFSVFKLVFDRQYLIDLWNQSGLFANALFTFASVFAFFITLIFIYGVAEMIKSNIYLKRNRKVET